MTLFGKQGSFYFRPQLRAVVTGKKYKLPVMIRGKGVDIRTEITPGAGGQHEPGVPGERERAEKDRKEGLFSLYISLFPGGAKPWSVWVNCLKGPRSDLYPFVEDTPLLC